VTRSAVISGYQRNLGNPGNFTGTNGKHADPQQHLKRLFSLKTIRGRCPMP
jgi:hypothetical protein